MKLFYMLKPYSLILLIIILTACKSNTNQQKEKNMFLKLPSTKTQESDIQTNKSFKKIIPAPDLVMFANGKIFMLGKDMEYIIGNTNDKITVPSGFVTDLASIPRILWTYLAPTGTYSKAAIIHDYLYWVQSCDRKQADNILLIGMKESGVNVFLQKIIYYAVRTAGGSAWKANKEEKEKRLLKIIPDEYHNIPLDKTWSQYRIDLVKKSIYDKQTDLNTNCCKYGDSNEVP